MSPLFWFYGSVGLTYARRGVRRPRWWPGWPRRAAGSARHLYRGALALGLTGGMRQSVLVLLLPLWLVAPCWGSLLRAGWASRAGSWWRPCSPGSLPMMWLTGGPAATSPPRRSSTARCSCRPRCSAARSTSRSPRRATSRSRWSWASARWPWRSWRCPCTCAARGGGRRTGSCSRGSSRPAVFYTLVHFGQAGYVLTFLPALVILLSRALLECGRGGSERLRRPRTGAGPSPRRRSPLLVLINTGFFVSARPCPREFDNRAGDTWRWRARRRVPRLDHEPHRGGAARARGGDPDLRRDHPRRLRSRRHRAPDRARQPALVSVAAPRDVLPARVPTIYQVQVGDEPPASTRRSPPSTILLTPGDLHRAPATGAPARLVRGSLGSAAAAAGRPARDPARLRPLPLRAAPPTGTAEHAGYTFVRVSR